MFGHVPQPQINHHFSLNAPVSNQGRSTSESSWSESRSDIQSLPPHQSPSLSPSSIQPYPMPRMTPSSFKYRMRWMQPRVADVTSLAGSINYSQPSGQIGFVAYDRQPRAPRGRISEACKTCRKRKSKCSGEKPKCSYCRKTGYICLGYAESANTSSRATSIGPLKIEEGDKQGSVSNNHSTELIPPIPGGFAGKRRSVDVVRGRGSTVDSHSEASLRSCALYGNCGGASVSSSQQKSGPRSLSYEVLSPSFSTKMPGAGPTEQYLSHTPAPWKDTALREASNSGNIPFYDQEDMKPNSRLVTHLVESFFANNSSNYPFLQRDSFLRDVDEKRAESILVDAVCSVSANSLRHSSAMTLHSQTQRTAGRGEDAKFSNPIYASFFTRRVTAVLTDPAASPTAAAVYACLLLAYQEFSNDPDGHTWMYLGAAIRIARDLGEQGRKGKYNGLDEIILQSSQELLSKHGAIPSTTYQEGSVDHGEKAADFKKQKAAKTRSSNAGSFPQYISSSDFPGYTMHPQSAMSSNQSSYANSMSASSKTLAAYRPDILLQTGQLQHPSSDFPHHCGFPTFNQGHGIYTFAASEGGGNTDAIAPFNNATIVGGMPRYCYSSENASTGFNSESFHPNQTDERGDIHYIETATKDIWPLK